MKSELEKCLLCKCPQCENACPIATPIRDVIKLARDGKITEAGALLFENNPLTAFCGAVCPSFCKNSCVLAKSGRAVDFQTIENHISTQYLDKISHTCTPEVTKKALVVGSGPAGLAAAYFLRKHGYSVEVRERDPKIDRKSVV